MVERNEPLYDLDTARDARFSLEPRVLRAIQEIYSTYGDSVSVVNKAKSLIKFGHSAEIDNTGYKTVWEGTTINDEPPLFGDPSLGNVVTEVVSETGGDTQTLTVEGHTKSGDDLTFVVQTVVLTGQTPAILGTALHTCTRAYNSSATEFTGPVYFYDPTDGETLGVPTDPSDVALYLAGSVDTHGQQSGNAFTAISSTDYFIVTQLISDVNRSGNGNYDVEWQKRSTTGVWRPMEMDLALDTAATSLYSVDLDPCLIVPSNNYIRALAQSDSATDGEVSVEIGGFLASVIT
jgi:hypothetical protein